MSTSYRSGSYDNNQIGIGGSNSSAYIDERENSGGGGAENGNTSLYASCSRVPLIKSPAVRVPPPIVLPINGIHPLPPNLQEYFVYPFNLEKFVLDSAEKREKARKEDLLRKAPGWNEDGKVLEPTKRSSTVMDGIPSNLPGQQQQKQQQQTQIESEQDGIDEIARMLDRLDKSSS